MNFIEPMLEPRSSRTKRSENEFEDQNDLKEEPEEDDDYTKSLEGEDKCRARLWKCLGGVAKGSLHYMNEPEGVTG